jgi:hypothetical protein
MPLSARTSECFGFARRLAGRWRSWNSRMMAEPDCCGQTGVEPTTDQVGASRSDLHVLAGKWPDSFRSGLVECHDAIARWGGERSGDSQTKAT